jgi:hypothetical protein
MSVVVLLGLFDIALVHLLDFPTQVTEAPIQGKNRSPRLQCKARHRVSVQLAPYCLGMHPTTAVGAETIAYRFRPGNAVVPATRLDYGSEQVRDFGP